MKNVITVSTEVRGSIKSVWESWTLPEHIVHWNFADDSWHAPAALNDLRVGGKFSYRMEAKDGSAGFDFSGVYTEIVALKVIAYTMDDGRTARVTFEENGDSTIVTEVFEAEQMNPVEMQQAGWQMILDNFKRYTESLG
jgi:uncharacterized protein YndB with AHSA1/START domain